MTIMHTPKCGAMALTFLVVFFLLPSAQAADAVRYQLPPQAMIDMVDAPQIPQTILSPSNEWLMMLERPALPPLAENSVERTPPSARISPVVCTKVMRVA